MVDKQSASEPESGRSNSTGVEVIRAVRIRNPAGLHARPCHAIVSKALAHESDLWVTCAGREVNGKSILELMTLCAPCEAELSFRAKGQDAAKLIAELEALVNAGFDEMEG
jgi:phosphotransferase system HPr (HPr) family protein